VLQKNREGSPTAFRVSPACLTGQKVRRNRARTGDQRTGEHHDQGFQSGGGVSLDVSGDRHGVGGLAGGQIGCNYQIRMLVLGIEGEGFWSGMKITIDRFDGINGSALAESASIRNKWDYDVAGRFGVAFDRALAYGKAGWVAGSFDWNAADVNCGPPAVTRTESVSADKHIFKVGLNYKFDWGKAPVVARY